MGEMEDTLGSYSSFYMTPEKIGVPATVGNAQVLLRVWLVRALL
jgi:hypothetical protein